MAKNLPVTGEAFLGSDPMAHKVLRVAFGFDTTDGVNDVILSGVTTGVAGTLLTVSDTLFVVTDLATRVVVVASAAATMGIGTDSAPDQFASGGGAAANEMAKGHAFSTLGYNKITQADSAADGEVFNAAEARPKFDAAASLVFPQDSTDSVVVTFSASTDTADTGDFELYVFYAELAHPSL